MAALFDDGDEAENCLTIFSVLFFQRSSPMALYCLLVVAIACCRRGGWAEVTAEVTAADGVDLDQTLLAKKKRSCRGQNSSRLQKL